MTKVASESLQQVAHDPVREYVRRFPELKDDARWALNNSSASYRVKVGCAVLAYNASTHEIDTLSAGNLKPTRHQQKICAEAIALRKAKKAGATKAIGLAIMSTSQPEVIESIAEIVTPTLMPCTPCQGDFDDETLIEDDTLIGTISEETGAYQVYLWGKMRQLHLDKNVDALQRVSHSGFKRWDRRVEMYDHLVSAESSLPLEEQRSRPTLAQMALLATDVG